MDVRDAVRKRDGYRCVCCKRKSSANDGRAHDVHRIFPGGNYVLGNCITLCRGCHAYMPKKPEQLIWSTYKGIFGVFVGRTCKKSEKLIAEIRKLIHSYRDETSEVGVFIMGVDDKEWETGKVPKQLIRREEN